MARAFIHSFGCVHFCHSKLFIVIAFYRFCPMLMMAKCNSKVFLYLAKEQKKKKEWNAINSNLNRHNLFLWPGVCFDLASTNVWIIFYSNSFIHLSISRSLHINWPIWFTAVARRDKMLLLSELNDLTLLQLNIAKRRFSLNELFLFRFSNEKWWFTWIGEHTKLKTFVIVTG